MSARIAVNDLRVGMFVHLDLGWWAHPFALSSFKLTSVDQIATIRGLGLTQVRWSPEKSALDHGDAMAPDASAAVARPDPVAEPSPPTPEASATTAGNATAPDLAPVKPVNGQPSAAVTQAQDVAALRAHERRAL